MRGIVILGLDPRIQKNLTSSDEDRGDEWFISSFLFGLHLLSLTSGKGEFSLMLKTSSGYRKAIRTGHRTELIPVCPAILSFPSEDIV
jgi:hypothetical protein